jgi:hypothetical protein
MKKLTSNYSPAEYEKYGSQNFYHTLDQQEEISKVEARVSSQIDWLAQMLGWSGPDYWGKLSDNILEKRSLLTGSFGFYNGFVFPEVLEVRAWENSIVVTDTVPLTGRLEVFIGENSLEVTSVSTYAGGFILKFSELSSKVLENFSSGEQLKVICRDLIPSPFLRPEVGISGDSEFIVETGEDGSLTLHPHRDETKKTPFIFNTLFQGSRYWFDKPVELLAEGFRLEPKYDFNKNKWWFTIPTPGDEGIPLIGTLSLSGTHTTDARLKAWEDPSDWLTLEKIEGFKGVWGDKGGPLPLHFSFDSLSLHGFDERLSVYLPPVSRSIPFDQLLEHVYMQKVSTSSGPPSPNLDQLWWNSETGIFSMYRGGSLNCGPWVEILYPKGPDDNFIRDFIFPNVSSFVTSVATYPEGTIVEILDMRGLGPEHNVFGLKGYLRGSGSIILIRNAQKNCWNIHEAIPPTVTSFIKNCQSLPAKVVVRLLNSLGLSPRDPGGAYEVSNLDFRIEERQSLLMMKGEVDGSWYISPPSNLKYIGNTRLFRGGEDFPPEEGEMAWDFSNPDIRNRGARVFTYNRWVEDEELGWRLEGDWVAVREDSSAWCSNYPDTINFGTVKVYCDGEKLEEGVSLRGEDYQITYSVDTETGSFNFLYIPVSFTGVAKLPKIEISDSITGVFRFDITRSVFSGLTYKFSPNIEDSETLLRIWKTKPLQVSDTKSEADGLRYLNPLRADENSGPSDPVWSRFHIRLPPVYSRDGVEWQRVAQLCQNFSYWGTPIDLEDMEFSSRSAEPEIYERLILKGSDPGASPLVYSEPYLYSDLLFSNYGEGDYDNSDLLPSFEDPYDDFLEAGIEDYSPLNCRRADLNSPYDEGFGDWEGRYFSVEGCVGLTGHLSNDILNESLTPSLPPVWDSSIYKLPSHSKVGKDSGKVDSNNFVIGYAFFASDISAAGEPVFDFESA